MRLVFLGCTQFSKEILEFIFTQKNVEIVGIFSMPKNFKISYSDKSVNNKNFADLSVYAKLLNVPYSEINSVPGQRLNDHYDTLKELNPDIILVMGWYYMVNSKIRNVAKYGAWGIHASLLPRYAGGAPLVWAIINGEKETGVTLFRMEDGVDDGDIIAQRAFDIEKSDTIKEVYEKATIASKNVLCEVFEDFSKVTFSSQRKEDIEVWPQRKPEDGEIDWSQEPEKIKDFIRAQTKPYPGAWTIVEGRKVIIWDADIIT